MDITSTSNKRYAQILSPFYPHYNIPIPFSEGYFATCVEAIWQGLKVFQCADVDFDMFKNDTMKNRQIYLPAYQWVLENLKEVNEVVMRIKERSYSHDIVLLDYNTNIDFRDISSPLAHAGLVKLYIEGKYPNESEKYQPLTKEEKQNKKIKKATNAAEPTQLTLFKD